MLQVLEGIKLQLGTVDHEADILGREVGLKMC